MLKGCNKMLKGQDRWPCNVSSFDVILFPKSGDLQI